MKFFAIVLLGLLCVAMSTSYPVDEEHSIVLSRARRFTCDVLSVEAKGVKLNHAACAANCVLRHGKTGGYCNGQQVCICR